MGFSTERNHDLAPSLAVMDRSGFGGRRSLPDALQSPETSGMIFQEQAFWANVVLRKSTLSRLLILHQRSEKNSLAIVQAACVVAPKIDLYETKLANNIALGALEKIGGKSLKTPYVLTIIQDFFKKRNLQSEVLYDTPFCILFRDESIATRIAEAPVRQYITYFSDEVKTILQICQKYGPEKLHEKIYTEGIFANKSKDTIHEYIRALVVGKLFPDNGEWSQMEKQGITIWNVWEKVPEIFNRINTAVRYLTPEERKVALEAVNLAKTLDPTQNEFLHVLAQNTGHSISGIKQFIYDKIIPTLFTKEERTTRGVGVNLWQLLQQRNAAVLRIMQQAKEAAAKEDFNFAVAEYCLKNITTNERDTIAKVSKNFGISEEAVHSIIIGIFLRLYPDEEKQKFLTYQQQEDEPTETELGQIEADGQLDKITSLDHALFAADGLDMYVKEITDIPQQSNDQIVAWARQRDEGDKRAEGKIVQANLRLVIFVIKKYFPQLKGQKLLDAIQDGNLGLMDAARKFSGERKAKFSTYATFWIRAKIGRGSRLDRPVHIPEGEWKYINQINDAEESLVKHGKKPTAENVAKLTGLDILQVRDFQGLLHPVLSLDMSYDLNDDRPQGDFVEDKNINVEAEALLNELSPELAERFRTAGLSSREMFVLMHRFGFIDNDEHTLDEIGKMMGGYGRGVIDRILKRASEKLKNAEDVAV